MVNEQELLVPRQAAQAVSTSDAKIDFKLHILEKHNYTIWKAHTKNVLEAKGLLPAIEAELPNSTREKQARALLTSALNSDNQMKVINCDSAFKIWKRLEAIYENKSSFEKENLLNKLHSFRISSSREISSGISQMETIAAKLRLLGEQVSDDSLMSAILRALPRQFSTFITVWKGTAAAERTIENLLTRLMAEVEDSEPRESALYSKHFRKPRNAPRSPRQFAKTAPTNPKANDVCRHCGKKGHWKKDCYQLKNLQASNQGRSSPRNQQRRNNYRKSNSKPNRQRTNTRSNPKQFRQEARALMANKTNVSTWIVDSGASIHLTNNFAWLRDYKSLIPKLEISLGDDSKMYAEGMGDVLTEQGVLKQVYYVPESANNLFSESSCARKGVKILTLGTKKKFMYGSETIFEAHLTEGGLYVLNLDVHPNTRHVNRAATLSEWHQRFGHTSNDTIKILADNHLVEGLKIASKDTDEPECVHCAKSKLRKASHPTRSTPKATTAGKVLHFDTVGPMPEESLGGSKYALLCKDEFSGYKIIKFVSHKGDITGKVKECISQAELETGTRALCICSDNGTEFVNRDMDNFLQDRGIMHCFSASYTPQQNGLIEREVRTITEAGRAMLLQSGLPKSLWAEAMNTAVYSLNRSLIKNNNRTPYELWFGRKPNVKNMRVFGQRAIVLLQKNQRDKLEEKGIELRFVGYTETFNTLKFYDSESGCTMVSCDYKFLNLERPEASSSVEVSADRLQGCDMRHYASHQSELGSNNEDSLDSSQRRSTINTDYDHHELESEYEPEEESEYSERETEVSLQSPPLKTQRISIPANKPLSFELKPQTSSQEEPSADCEERNLDSIIKHIPKNLRYRSGRPPELATTRLRPRKGEGSKDDQSEEHQSQLHAKLSTLESEDDPAGYEEAMNRSDKQKWLEAMKEEIQSLKKNHVWELVDCPENVNVVTNKWVLRIKRKPDGTVERYRARLVARGFSQKHGIDYNETYSPVVNTTTIRLLLAYATKERLKIAQFDVKTAFLYGNLEENIYMEQPEGFIEAEGKVCHLKRSLYGLKQAPRQWNKRFSQFLKRENLKALENDECIFYRRDPLLIIAIYVDDGIIFARDQLEIDQILSQLQKEFDIHSVEPTAYLGFQIAQLDDGRLAIHQTSYINKILKKFNMTGTKPVEAPVTMSRSIMDGNSNEPLSSDMPYREAIGSLMYAAVTTRIDIAYAVNKMSRKVAEPTVPDWKDVMKIFKYLVDKQDLAIVYDPSDEMGLHAYCDADFAGDIQSSKSTTGLIILYCGAPIHWRSSRQSLVTLSSTEAEVVSLCTTVKDIMWLRKIAEELDIIKPDPIPIFCDNQSAIRITTKQKSIQRTRHMSAQAAYVVEQVEEKKISIHHVSTKQQLADMLTKPTTAHKFVQNCKMLMTALVLLMSMYVGYTNALVLDRVAPVVWVQTGKYVSRGINDYDYELRFTNPCVILEDVVSLTRRKRKRSIFKRETYYQNQPQHTQQRRKSSQTNPQGRTNTQQTSAPSRTTNQQQPNVQSQANISPQANNFQPNNINQQTSQTAHQQNNIQPQGQIVSYQTNSQPQAIIIQQPTTYQGPTGQNTGFVTAIQESTYQEQQTDMDLALKEATEYCNLIYDQYVLSPIKQASLSFNPQESPRYKRSLVGGVITGVFLSNVLTTVADHWLRSSDISKLEDKETIIERKLEKLNQELNVTELIENSTSESLRSTTEAVKFTQRRLSTFVNQFPELVFATNYLTMRMMGHHEALTKLVFKTRTTRLDLWAVSSLIQENQFTDIDEDSAHISELTSPKTGVLKIQFSGRTYDNTTQVYRVDAFKIWTNLTDDPTLVEYVGERFLIYNQSINCVKAINEPAQTYATESCDQQNGIDPNLAHWSQIIKQEDPYAQPNTTQYKSGWPYNYIYCWKLNITIGEETIKCPPYVFRLNATIGWRTSDDTKMEGTSIRRKNELRIVNHNVHIVHFKNNEHLIDENYAFEKVKNLKVELARIKQENVAIKLPIEGGGLTYITTMKILFVIITLLMVCIIALTAYKHNRDTRRHQKVMRTVTDGIYGSGTYETIRSTRRHTNITSPAQVNLTLNSSPGTSLRPQKPDRPPLPNRVVLKKERAVHSNGEKLYEWVAQ
jgi:hypothetical protein